MRAACKVTGLNFRKIRALKASGCEGFADSGRVDCDAVMRYVAEKERQKRGRKKEGETDERIADPRPESAVSGEKGAGKTLNRLEAEEVRLYGAYVRLEDDPDSGSDVVSYAYDKWLKASKVLLDYEKGIKESKRDAGELITRTEAIEFCNNFFSWVNVGISDAIRSMTPRLAEVKTDRLAASIVDPAIRDCVRRALKLGVKSGKVPSWVMDSIFFINE